MEVKMIKKEITFIYYDTSDKSLYTPIAEEALKRGYKVKYSQNEFEKCEIGFYCQHVNFPQYSKFSVIMLHDIVQQHANWPNIWFYEPWNKYDIGILPSKQWINNWNKCSHLYYVKPRIGVFEVGWPKADTVKYYDTKSKEKFRIENKINPNKKTILYAPSWENDNKQDDFVKAMLKLDVNILIKQGSWNSPKWLKTRPDISENIKKMNKLHSDISNVIILDEQLNIFDAIAVSDVLVSEESSTMFEAIMMGIPAVSVSNWLIPDQSPSRYPKCNYDFVVKTTKENLSECISTIINNYDDYKKEAEIFKNNNFSNIGSTSSIIMDIIDDCINGEKIRYKNIQANKKNNFYIVNYFKHIVVCIKKELINNYAVRIPFIKKLYSLYLSGKRFLSK